MVVVAAKQASPAGATAEMVAVLRVGTAQDVGRRAEQEDALAVIQPNGGRASGAGMLCVLADGLGGHAAGQIASRLATAQIVQSYYAAPRRQPGNLLQAAIQTAHERVRVAAGESPGRRGMATTCVCAAIRGEQVWVANVGDSRAYLVRPGEGVVQITEDHSLAAQQVRQGLITAEEAASSDLRGVLLQSLGGMSPPQPYFAPPLPLRRGDLLVLCSDGLYEALDAPALRDYLLAAPAAMREVQPDLLARDLVAAARFHGAEDNISVVVAYCANVLSTSSAESSATALPRRIFLPQPAPDEPAATDPPPPAPPAAPAPTPAPAPLIAAPPAPAPVERGIPATAPPAPRAGPRRPVPVFRPVIPVPTRRWRATLRTAGRPYAPLALGAGGTFVLLLLARATVAAGLPAPAVLAALVVLAGAALLALLASDRGLAPGARPPAPAPPADRGLPPDLAPAALTSDLLRRVLQETPTPPAERALPGANGGTRPAPAPPAPAPAAPPASAPATALPAAPDLLPSYVNQAFTDALSRARQQWTFNLLMAFITTGLIILGLAISSLWILNGQSNVAILILGPGVTLLGVLNWLLTRPAAQLSRADNQISLLTLVWTNYAQELRSCTTIPDPTAAAACTGRAGADAVHYFNEILAGNPVPPA